MDMTTKYKRKLFGDAYGYQKAEAYLLPAQSWRDYYTGEKLDVHTSTIDHIVALKDAWNMGAKGFSPKQLKRFARDPLNLACTANHVNESKGSKSPFEWTTPNADCADDYLRRYELVCRKYNLVGGAPSKETVDRLGREGKLSTAPMGVPDITPKEIGKIPSDTSVGVPGTTSSAKVPRVTFYTNKETTSTGVG